MLETNTAYICGTFTKWEVKKMIEYDSFNELIKPEESLEKVKHKASIKPMQTLLAFRREMDEDLAGYNSLDEESIYSIHHVPPLEKRAHLIETE
mmetsp:Transcript_22981/g.26350  ORF Transcript_22981/g.26350 Transcript_22981/m.26350 type:complete len:94 (+) Transcript_22981:1277-1558(+)